MRPLIVLFISIFVLNAQEGKIDMHGGKAPKLPFSPKKDTKIYYGKVLEILDVANYKYLKVDENGTKIWVAISDAPVRVGDRIGYDKDTIMKNFKSKTLNRTFKEIIFANTLYLPKRTTSFKSMKDMLMHQHIQEAKKASIKPFENKEYYTIEELYLWKDKLKGKRVKIKGKVIKVAVGIMKKDWVHLSDGTGNEEDLTDDIVFTIKKANVKVGNEVEASGKVSLNKDFGFGYFYPVLLEDASFKVLK